MIQTPSLTGKAMRAWLEGLPLDSSHLLFFPELWSEPDPIGRVLWYDEEWIKLGCEPIQIHLGGKDTLGYWAFTPPGRQGNYGYHWFLISGTIARTGMIRLGEEDLRVWLSILPVSPYLKSV